MKLVPVGNRFFSLQSNDGLKMHAVWRIAADSAAADPAAFAAEVEAWCGKVGAPLRVPAADGAILEMPEYPVESISSKVLSPLSCEVEFVAAALTLATISSEEHERDGSWRRKGIFRVAGADPSALLPAAGAAVIWSGEDYQCERASAKSLGDAQWEVAITCLRTIRRVVGAVASFPATDGTLAKTIVYYANNRDYASLLAELAIDGPAPWAGANFVVREVNSVPSGTLGFLVTATAREVATRMLELVRSERFSGFDDFNNPLREVIWESRWQVRADDLSAFANITGKNAEWAAKNAIVTRIAPKRLSALEYELEIRAEALTNPDLYEQYYRDNRSNLEKRLDVSARLTEFLMTPSMAGWRRVTDNAYEEITGWDPAHDCPLLSTGPLDYNLIDSVMRTVQIDVVSYQPGGLAQNLKSLIEWGNGSRVFNGAVGGCGGSYLRVDMESEEIADNSGKRWTKFEGSWQMAPVGYEWNPVYWENK